MLIARKLITGAADETDRLKRKEKTVQNKNLIVNYQMCLPNSM